MMYKVRMMTALLVALAAASAVHAAKVVEEIEIRGMVTPASPKALSAALEEKLDVKVLGYNFYATASGWPTVKIEYDSSAVSRDQIDEVINSTEDPTGRPFKPDREIHVALLEEESKADSVLGGEAPDIAQITNPVPASPESHARGEKLYMQYCSKCHGETGNGAGPSAHGFSTHPRQLWVWHNANASADPYLFWFITNGRTDMPPWGVILSENERWDLVNYIKTFEPPKQ